MEFSAGQEPSKARRTDISATGEPVPRTRREAARWLLTHRVDPAQDLLLVGFDDGRMGAASVIGGRAASGW